MQSTRITRFSPTLCGALVAQLFVAIAHGQGAAVDPAPVDKTQFNLFNPTPSHLLRELTTDGPGTTESACTVDAGHFQLEMTLVSYASDRETFDGVTYPTDAWSVALTTLKVGLLNRLDAQLVLEPYHRVRERANGERMTRRGFGDTTVRLKYNIWGNDRGRTAGAVIPFVKFPTSDENLGNDSVEGGLLLPLEATLPWEFYLGVTTGFGVVRDEEERGYHPEMANSLALGRDIFGELFGYVEFSSVVSTERGAPWWGAVGAGLIYALSENIQLNAGLNVGITHSADDWNPFVGLAWRY